MDERLEESDEIGAFVRRESDDGGWPAPFGPARNQGPRRSRTRATTFRRWMRDAVPRERSQDTEGAR